MYDFVLHFYVTAVGFVMAGTIASFSKMLTGQPMSFVIPMPMNRLLAVGAVMTRVFAGPFLLVRNSLRGLMIQNRAIHWIILSFMLATLWSFFSGLFLIETVIRLMS